MKQRRREFLKTTGLLVGTAITSAYPAKSILQKSNGFKMNGNLKLSYKPYTLELKHVFTIATNSRTTTPVVLTEVEYDGMIGYGEASLPPYLGESQQTVSEFLAKIDLSRYDNIFDLENILSDIDMIAPNNTAAKASIDIALHDLVGKLLNRPWFNILGI